MRSRERKPVGWRALRPVLLRLALAYVVLVTGLFALGSLTEWDVGGWAAGVGSGLGAAIGSWFREADHRALSGAQKRLCQEVERTGVPSGDRAVDLVALRHLKEQAQNHGRVMIGVLGTFYTAAAAALVTAAILRSPWWAVGLLPLVFIGARIASRWEWPGQYRQRRDRLRQSLPPTMR